MWGGTGTSSEQLDFQPGWPQSIEVGNLNLPAIASIAAAAEHWLANRDALTQWRDALGEFVAGLRSRFSDSELRLLGHDATGEYLPVISLQPRHWPVHDIAAILDSSFQIEVRAGYHCAALIHPLLDSATEGTLRFSLGHNTKSIELQAAVDALSEIVNSSGE